MRKENLFWLLFSVLGKSINLATSFYNHIMVSHPIIVLCIYLLAYFLASIYIFTIGDLLSNIDVYNGPEIIKKDWLDD